MREVKESIKVDNFLEILVKVTIYKSKVEESCKRYRKPWVNACILKQIKQKHQLYKVYIKRKNTECYNNYKTQRNLVKRAIELAKRKYYLNLFAQSKNNAQKTWRNIKMIQNKTAHSSSTLPNNLRSEGSAAVSDPIHVANKLNEHFVHKGPKLSSKIRASRSSFKKYLGTRNSHNMIFFKIKKSQVKSLLSELKLGKAPGHDGISAHILKWCIPYITEILTKIFNKCVNNGVYPDILKIARVTALPKSGDDSDADNFRPISSGQFLFYLK